MGDACSKFQQSNSIASQEQEEDLTFKNYSSTYDSYFKKIEGKFNYLSYFSFHMFLKLLSKAGATADETASNNTENQEASRKQNEAFLKKLEKVEFSLFIENKIIKNFIVKVLNITSNEDENIAKIFSVYMMNLYDSLVFANGDLFTLNNNGQKPKKSQIQSLQKLSLLPLAFLYCSGGNLEKVNALYNLFCDESQGNFLNSREFRDYIFFLFIIPSTCSLRSLKKTAENFSKNLDSISNEEYVEKTQAFEVKDIVRLREKFILEFFLGAEKLSRQEYLSRFTEGGESNFGWIFSTNGIRHFLEINNDEPKETSV
jgi:hypothetical protein